MATASNDACVCGCREGANAAVHAIATALAHDDLDRAITLGLIAGDAAVEPLSCASCSDDCRARLQAARTERMQALAARDRYRIRNARIERRARERAEHRAAAMPFTASVATDAPAPVATALPSAAAAALARARAKAAARHKP
jgi:succinate dehydrogenase/fumarate reductase flavoprotein subunit